MAVVDVNGARLWYDEAGSGPAVLLLHGGLGDSGLWEPVVPFLAERFRTILLSELPKLASATTGPRSRGRPRTKAARPRRVARSH